MSDAATAPVAGASRRSRYRRILLKLSGEALLGDRQYGVDPAVCAFIAAPGRRGPRPRRPGRHRRRWRQHLPGPGRRGRAGMDRATGDYIGMLATVMNGLALQDALERAGVPTRVMTAIAMNEVAEPYIRRRAIRHLEKGRVAIFVAGTGNPYFTTDTAAALRAVEIDAEVLLKATKVDGVYDSDPMTNPDARRYAHLDYADLLRDQLKVLDATAVSLCMENDLPIVVFDLNQPDNITRVAAGEPVGTLISSASDGSPTPEVRQHEQRDPRRRRPQDGAAPSRPWSATSRASGPAAPRPSLVERIHVDYYGTQTPLNQLAGISVPEPHQIVIQPWDRGVLGAIEKAITKSDIGLMPNVDGTVVRLNIPPLTEERRKDLVKVVHKRMEEAGSRSATSAATPPTTSRRRSATATSARTRRTASSSASRRRPTGTSPRSTAAAAPRNRRSSRSSGPRTAGQADRRAARGARAATDARRPRPTPATPSCRPRTCRATSRSSWTATAAGRARATCPSSRATPPASRPSAASSGTPSGAASRS